MRTVNEQQLEQDLRLHLLASSSSSPSFSSSSSSSPFYTCQHKGEKKIREVEKRRKVASHSSAAGVKSCPRDGVRCSIVALDSIIRLKIWSLMRRFDPKLL